MGKLCTTCLETYRQNGVATRFIQSPKGLFQDCPKAECAGQVFNIDDRLLPAIVVLNEKGYDTHKCSGGEGAFQNSGLYVEFEPFIESFHEIPYLFKTRKRLLGEGNDRLVLYYEPMSEDPYDFFPELMTASVELYEWALDLPSLFDNIPLTVMTTEEFAKHFSDQAEESGEDVFKAIPTGKISLGKMSKIVEKESVKEEPVQAEKEEAPKKKRGRPKKEDK